MRGLSLFISVLFMATAAFAGENFTVKFEVRCIDHGSAAGAQVMAFRSSTNVAASRTDAEGKGKLEFEKGGLFDVQISLGGYFGHVVHNVHDEGSKHITVVLYKLDKGAGVQSPFNHSFESVKKMTIPADQLGAPVAVASETTLKAEEIEAAKAIAAIGKKQVKAQKKIDSIERKRSSADSAIAKLDSDMAAGKTERTTGEAEKSKWQQKVVAYTKELEKLRY